MKDIPVILVGSIEMDFPSSKLAKNPAFLLEWTLNANLIKMSVFHMVKDEIVNGCTNMLVCVWLGMS